MRRVGPYVPASCKIQQIGGRSCCSCLQHVMADLEMGVYGNKSASAGNDLAQKLAPRVLVRC